MCEPSSRHTVEAECGETVAGTPHLCAESWSGARVYWMSLSWKGRTAPVEHRRLGWRFEQAAWVNHRAKETHHIGFECQALGQVYAISQRSEGRTRHVWQLCLQAVSLFDDCRALDQLGMPCLGVARHQSAEQVSRASGAATHKAAPDSQSTGQQSRQS